MAIFNISDEDFYDKTKIKIIDGIAGAGKSTSVVSELEAHGEKFCLASFSNALKFAAQDKFGCEVDTICGLCFINTPYPRTDEREVTEFNTVVLDEILLDGVEAIRWIKHNVGKVNIIALTDSHQMLSVENSDTVIKEFDKLCKLKDTIYVQLTETRRARNKVTKCFYDTLFNLPSNEIYNLNDLKNILLCDVIPFTSIEFNPADTYICHSNRIEHEVYRRYDLSSRRDIGLIPKNHISRKRTLDMSKYPICDQTTALEKRIDSYLQAANVASPVRFQGKEVEEGNNCYFIVEESSYFTGREIYTVGTRCQDIASIKIVVMQIEEYKGPSELMHTKVVDAKRLNIPDHPKTFRHVTGSEMAKILKEYGDPGAYYRTDYVTSGDHIIYATLSADKLAKFADINEDSDNYTVVIRKNRSKGRVRNINSIAKKDPTMHFDYMERVYDILKSDVTPPRINNPKNCKKEQFSRLCDIYSAFPTILHNAPMPKAGMIYTERDDSLLNFYKYKGNIVNKGSLITEELAIKLGNSEYAFSTDKQTGCQIGHYTYEQCHATKEKKKAVNENFLWGILEKDFYKREEVSLDGEISIKYVKNKANALELVACALWSSLTVVMLDAINSINTKDFIVATDGLYYTSDKMPKMPEWCDYRIEDKDQERLCGKDANAKYSNIIYKTYEDLPSEKEDKIAKKRERRAAQRAELEAIRAARNS